jgi:hypothetical protein
VDPALAAPLPIAAMLSSATADDAMARALIAKRNPEIEAVRAKDRQAAMQEGRQEGLQEGRQEGRQEGLVRGKAGALLLVLAGRGISISSVDRKRILGETDIERLDRWIACAARCADIAEVFAVL